MRVLGQAGGPERSAEGTSARRQNSAEASSTTVAHPPPDFRRELVLSPKMACVSLSISKEFAKATEPPRPGKGQKSVSEAFLSLFDRTSPKLVRLKKMIVFQWIMILATLLSS
ncbi:MAG: hypothetical protein ACK52I_09080 [Pseudomonadota bacterium]